MYSQYENVNILVWEKWNATEHWDVPLFLLGPLLKFNNTKYNPRGLFFGGGGSCGSLYMKEFSVSKVGL